MKNWISKKVPAPNAPLLPGLGWSILVLLSACQSYTPSPLDTAAHQAAWQARALNDGSLQAFLEQRQAPLPGPQGELDLSDGLDLHEARLVALAFNPELRLARLEAGLAAAHAQYAGQWTDPEFALSALRATDDIPDPWIVGPSLSFSLPLTGRTGAETEHAAAQHQVARTAVLHAEWRIWSEVWRAWQEWSAALLREQETKQLQVTLGELIPRVGALAKAGEVTARTASNFKIEYSQRTAELLQLHGLTLNKEQALLALMGLTAAANLELVPYLSHLQEGRSNEDFFPVTLHTEFSSELAQRNLELLQLRDQYAVAEKSLALEIAQQISDPTLGPVFESDSGQPRLGLIGGISLPFFHANQEGIAAARAERLLARARYETALEIMGGRWQQVQQKIEAITRQRSHMEQHLMPLISQQLQDAMRLMELGEGQDNSEALLMSLILSHQARLDWIDATLAVSAEESKLVQMRGPEPTVKQLEETEGNN
ncbi:MAG: hypothetical protein CMJ86_00215 [Planctomycetes bacterium]|nr:hypothetical protein [Planctomycetota bacterium]